MRKKDKELVVHSKDDKLGRELVEWTKGMGEKVDSSGRWRCQHGGRWDRESTIRCEYSGNEKTKSYSAVHTEGEETGDVARHLRYFAQIVA